ncbi:MAG: acyl-CoA dehydrogenase family protein [Arcticibacter sp.]
MDIFSLPSSATDIIGKHTQASEEAGQLHPEIIKLIERERWFKLYLPEEHGGRNTDLPGILRLLESLAKADGSTGWTVTLCSGASWFAGFLEDELRDEIFLKPDTCITGSGATSGTAVKSPEGYLVTGSWKYSSGALHATHFTANCFIRNQDGSDVLDEKGEPSVRSFVFKRSEIHSIPTWSSIGMVATGSHGFEVSHLAVQTNRSFLINGDMKMQTNAGNYPFLQLAETTLAVNFSGMALHFLELAKTLVLNARYLQRFSESQAKIVQEVFTRQQQLLMEARKNFFQTADRSWHDLQKGSLQNTILEELSRTSRKLAHTSRRLSENLWPYCGLEAARKDSELNRVWRDIHTASQHTLLTFES